ncbi:uncharacterized protein ACLA_002470 [Aspergillus clavatus NRRL 1]|uniref:Fumarylacetoacetase n=1 Tax=Aspergillus clavatus (strain ATCC 1007 / CBS 513.65 / DSM 816 / NCTC 3887 / NRRL 1 / QM 1276 / 107) TaxID=344612 RepID=A1C568_ASPCL|nr:uncharacterized protein ACLA_002470 [Aspergillus clavatus NRRL 1]EAW14836.1 hypothetical protein ACLA_002470 [Aspergillus clavatus NRRL 1]
MTDALEPFRAAGPPPCVDLQDPGAFNYAIIMKVELEHGGCTTVLSESPVQDLFWSARQITECNLRTGDILGTGTVSGSTEKSYGFLLEITQGGKAGVCVGELKPARAIQ